MSGVFSEGFHSRLLPQTSARAAFQAQGATALDRDEALKISRAAIGRRLSDHRFLDRAGNPVHLRDFRGRPLVVSLIYTSCYHSCSVFTRYLGEIVDVAREALEAELRDPVENL